MKKVLICSPVRQAEDHLEKYLDSLLEIDYDLKDVSLYFAVNDSIDKTEEVMHDWLDKYRDKFLSAVAEVADMGNTKYTHGWDVEKLHNLAKLRNLCLTKSNGCDYVFMIDSDVVVKPETLKVLISKNKDIIAELQYYKRNNRPNVWIRGQYDVGKAEDRFWEKIKIPGVYKVSGLMSVVLISKKVIDTGVTYTECPGVIDWGEDRHFCQNAKNKGFELFVDTSCPAFHMY